MRPSIREGVLAGSAGGRVTVLSDSARELLALREDDFEGRRLVDLPLDVGVLEVLVGEDDVHDRVLMVDGRLIVLNRNRIHNEGRAVGTVTTMRDRTELLAMQSELNAREAVTDTRSDKNNGIN